PESVVDLQLTSRMFQSRVIECAFLRETIKFVETLIFGQLFEEPNYTGRQFNLCLKVPINKARLFDMRLNLFKPSRYSNTF
ncbi:hypothetical protein PENTCL1PPCAC_24391, partial [Pristionchus entomophagus]